MEQERLNIFHDGRVVRAMVTSVKKIGVCKTNTLKLAI